MAAVAGRRAPPPLHLAKFVQMAAVIASAIDPPAVERLFRE